MININIDQLKQVLVVGANTMGHPIAQVYGLSEIEMDLIDISQ